MIGINFDVECEKVLETFFERVEVQSPTKKQAWTRLLIDTGAFFLLLLFSPIEWFFSTLLTVSYGTNRFIAPFLSFKSICSYLFVDNFLETRTTFRKAYSKKKVPEYKWVPKPNGIIRTRNEIFDEISKMIP